MARVRNDDWRNRAARNLSRWYNQPVEPAPPTRPSIVCTFGRDLTYAEQRKIGRLRELANRLSTPELNEAELLLTAYYLAAKEFEDGGD